MGDTLGRTFAVIFGCLIMFIVPVMIIAQKMDTIAQSYIDNAVVEFVDNARAAGKITPEAYEELCNEIDSAHMTCEIRMVHSAAYTVPVVDESGNYVYDATGWIKTETYRYDYNKEEILDVIYASDPTENIDYQLKNGDYLKVEVKNTTPTLGTKLFRLFTPKVNDVTLFTTYGGYVGNNMQ